MNTRPTKPPCGKTLGLSDASVDIAEPLPAADGDIAIILTHGMGQQIAFETLDSLTLGLQTAAAAAIGARHPCLLPKPVVRDVRLAGQALRRVELRVTDGTKEHKKHNVHLYEAYWAPKTEGRVTLRDVMWFLWDAAISGFGNSVRECGEWLFGKYARLPRSPRTRASLFAAVTILGSLTLINSAITGLAALKLTGLRPGGYMSPLLLRMTAAAWLALPSGVAAGVALLLAMRAKKGAAGAWSLNIFTKTVLWILLAVAGNSIVVCASLFTILGHQRLFRSAMHWHGLVKDLLAVGPLLCAGSILFLILASLVPTSKAPFHRGRSLILNVLFGLELVYASLIPVVLITLLVWDGNGDRSSIADIVPPWLASSLWIWPVLAAAGKKVRTLLIQYVGDVAVYVSPNALDRFDEIRTSIKKCVLDVFGAVYSEKSYKHVIVAGHSLGSVITYDALNRIIEDDRLAGKSVDAANRTRLLLTFGSPLDKITFLFAAKGRHTTEVREALAVAGQPLLQSYALRPERWVNVYSKQDIISGCLGFYDIPNPSLPTRAICNVADPQASIPLVAHTEYWANPMIWKTIYDSIC